MNNENKCKKWNDADLMLAIHAHNRYISQNQKVLEENPKVRMSSAPIIMAAKVLRRGVDATMQRIRTSREERQLSNCELYYMQEHELRALEDLDEDFGLEARILMEKHYPTPPDLSPSKPEQTHFSTTLEQQIYELRQSLGIRSTPLEARICSIATDRKRQLDAIEAKLDKLLKELGIK